MQLWVTTNQTPARELRVLRIVMLQLVLVLLFMTSPGLACFKSATPAEMKTRARVRERSAVKESRGVLDLSEVG